MHPRAVDGHRWGVILAGGEGVRRGEEPPQQFCPLLTGQTLLSQTRQRIARSISPDRTLFVLLQAHERYYKHELRAVPASGLAVQPGNRGTLPAILFSLLRIIHRDPAAVVGFFPSDHHYSEEATFMAGVELAFEAAGANPESVLLLGAAAKHAGTAYGWIEAAPAVSSVSAHGFLRVKRLWEKPTARTAQDLLERGCVWNTFVMVGRAQAFLDMICAACPELYRQFLLLRECFGSVEGRVQIQALYDLLAPADFSNLVLSKSSERLGVWCLGDVGWSGGGDPRKRDPRLSEPGPAGEWSKWNHEGIPVAAAAQ